VPLSTAQWLELLAHSPSPQTRAVAADVLGHQPDVDVLTALGEAVADNDPAVRREVYEALARSGERTLMPVLIRAAAKEVDATARETAERAAEYLAAGPPSPREAHAALANLESASEAARASAVRTLALRQDWRATKTLLHWIQGTDPQRRALAIRAVGDLGDPTAVPVLIAQLPEVGRTQSAVFASLANIGDESAAETFSSFFTAEHAETRRLAVRGLGRLQLPDLAEKLKRVAADPAITVRNELLLALESVPAHEKQALLLQALEDPIAPHRAAAIRQMSSGEAEAAGPAITKCLDDRDTLVRISAAEALTQLGYTASLDSLRKRARKTKNEDERAYYLTAIARLEKR
jgi:HEAT repeat protein